MNASLNAFFTEVAENKHLQERLYCTKDIVDVAVIAKELGFKISPAEVLKAQACRLIKLAINNPEEAKLATAGKKPNLGAQWGREGTGFLERAGYWLIQLNHWGCHIQSFDSEITNLLFHIDENNALKSQINGAKTIDAVSKIAQENNFEVHPTTLLGYQVLCILQLNDQNADLIAYGALGR